MKNKFMTMFTVYLIVALQSMKISLKSFLMGKVGICKPSSINFYLMPLMSL